MLTVVIYIHPQVLASGSQGKIRPLVLVGPSDIRGNASPLQMQRITRVVRMEVELKTSIRYH
jgi:hypothetical protein